MVIPTNLVSMGELLQFEEDENEVLSRIKRLAEQWLPQGWKDWQLVRDEGNEAPSVDQAALNKLRFALPTVGIAKAFNPEATSLQERPYRDMKLQMLKWPFCRGLVIAPSDLSIKLRGSLPQHELVIQSILPLKQFFLSRKDASYQLGNQDMDDDERLLVNSRRCSSSSSSRRSRLDAMEARQEKMESLLQELVSRTSSRDAPVSYSPHDDYSDEEDGEEYQLDDPASESEDPLFTSETFQAPSFLEEAKSLSFDFAPCTKQLEPLIPEPDEQLNKAASDCQRLGSPAWNKVRYADAQKRLQVAGVFAALQPNWQLSSRSASGIASDLLTKADASFGIISHGLLLQRKAISDQMQELMSKHPVISEDVKNIFLSSDSKFKNVSDDLLQYVCGKRAETIDSRRKLLEPQNSVTARFLRDIPPSETHLFDEKKLEALLASQPGSSGPPYKPRSQYQYKQRVNGRKLVRKEPHRKSSQNDRTGGPALKRKSTSEGPPEHRFKRSRPSSTQKSSGKGFRRH